MKDIYGLDPIDKKASMAISQAGCSDNVFIKRKDLIKILDKLIERQRTIRRILGLTRKQYKNRKYYRNHKCHKQYYNIDNRMLFQELLENGLRMETVKKELSKIKKRREKRKKYNLNNRQ